MQNIMMRLLIEGYGQGGVAFFVECTTNNPTRTVANVRAIFNKFDGILVKMVNWLLSLIEKEFLPLIGL